MASCMPESEDISEESCSDASEDYLEEDVHYKEEEEAFDSLGSYDSDQSAKIAFRLSDEDLEKILKTLHTSKAKRRIPFKDTSSTRTSAWSRKSSICKAAYTFFKVKRYLLKNVSFIFDPFDEDQRQPVSVMRSSILWPEPQAEEADDGVVSLKGLSVDGLLAMSCQGVAKENLKKLDEALKTFDQDTYMLAENDVDDLRDNLDEMGAKMIPHAARGSFRDFINCLANAIKICSRGEVAKEQYFQKMVEALLRCIMVCIKEEERVRVASETMDGQELEKIELLPVPLSIHLQKNLIVSAVPDVIMYERGRDETEKRIHVVIEVKGKAKDQVLHSDDEEEPSSLGCFDEESEDDQSVFEKMKSRKKSYMKRLDRDSRRFTKKFLPQLFGEILCCSVSGMVNTLGSTLGLAVIGFDVYFVTVVCNRKSIIQMLVANDSHIDIFITRPFNLCKRRDRQIVFKVLSAACYVNKPLKKVRSNDVETLDFGKLKITS